MLKAAEAQDCALMLLQRPGSDLSQLSQACSRQPPVYQQMRHSTHQIDRCALEGCDQNEGDGVCHVKGDGDVGK